MSQPKKQAIPAIRNPEANINYASNINNYCQYSRNRGAIRNRINKLVLRQDGAGFNKYSINSNNSNSDIQTNTRVSYNNSTINTTFESISNPYFENSKDSMVLNNSTSSTGYLNNIPFNFNFIPCTVNINKNLKDFKANSNLRLSLLSNIQKSQINYVYCKKNTNIKFEGNNKY
jgi:hypothetical protein